MRIEEQATLRMGTDHAWALVGDPLSIGKLSEQMTVEELEPGALPGIGTRYRVLLKVGAVPVGGTVEIVTFEPQREMCWTTLTGVDHRMRIRLREDPAGGTRLTVRFAYDTPGLLGGLVDVLSFPAVRRAIREIVQNVAALET